MIPIRELFEAHLTVKDLQRSMSFFGDALHQFGSMREEWNRSSEPLP
jgi:hypothetical protein